MKSNFLCLVWLLFTIFYVGQTKQKLNARISKHKNGKQYIDRVIQDIGWENFTVEVLEECESREQLNERETFWIRTLKCMSPNGYNLTCGGAGSAEITDETRAKMSAAHTGEKNHFFGKHHTPETRSMLSKLRTGKKLSAETREKMSKARKGRKPSAETCAKISAAHTGKKFTAERCLNISLAKRGTTPYKNLLAEMCTRTIFRALRLQRLWICSVAPVIITLLVNRQRRHYLIELPSNERSGGHRMKEDFRDEMRCIGMRIAGFRKLRNLTQEALADKLNINKNYLSQIETASGNKNISLPMLIRISRALDVELALLTDIDGVYKSDLKNFWSDMKDTFEQIKQLNDDMDKMLEQFERADKIFSSGGSSKT